MHIGKFVFAQITQFLPQRYFNRVVAKYNDRTRGWSMSHWNHLLVLMFGQLMGCGSLRELTDYTDEKIFREDAMSGWAKKEFKGRLHSALDSSDAVCHREAVGQPRHCDISRL